MNVGGAESLALTFAREAKRRNLDLTVCARAAIDGNPLEKELRATGVTVESLDARSLGDRAAFRKLLRIVRVREFNVIHAHLTYSAIWGAAASRVTGVPMLATLHVPPSSGDWKERVRQRMLSSALRRWAAKTIVVSEALRADWRDRLRDVSVIHNGIDVPAAGSDHSFRQELGIHANAIVVVTIAVLRRGKGIETLIDAAAEVVRSEPNVTFIVVGEGSMRAEWQGLAAAKNVPLIWCGYRRDTQRILAAADVLAHPSEADALPTVLLEAMAAERPVVATRVGGIPEIVDDGITGSLVPPRDASRLAAEIMKYVRSGELRRSAGLAGRAKVEREFSTAVWVDRLEQTYAEVRRG